MISKVEFIRQATALHPAAVKPKKKRVPITFWGLVGFVLLCFFTGFMVYGVCFEEFPLDFILMFVGFWVFFGFYYKAKSVAALINCLGCPGWQVRLFSAFLCWYRLSDGIRSILCMLFLLWFQVWSGLSFCHADGWCVCISSFCR